MPTNTYVALDKVTVGTATTSITFSGISSAYTDLVIAASFLPSVSTNQPYIQFNADTGTSTTNYSTTSLRGDGSSAASGKHTNQYGWFPVPGPGVGTNGNPEPWLINIMNYSNTTTFKSGLTRFNNASSIVSANAHLWRSTAAITTVTITMETGNFAAGSTFSLYGIAAQTVPGTAKATGGTITYDNFGNVIHTFTSSGTFTPSVALTCDYLVVAGGGGSSNATAGVYDGGAAGAGGLRSSVTATGGGGTLESPLTLASSTDYTVTVGAGSPQTNSALGNNGSNSVFATITSLGGGGGGGGTTAGANGGSGGGNASGYGVGSGTAGQGFAGQGSPGGGAGGLPSGSVGGIGVATTISGTSTYYAGGGGGGSSAGGLGGGGAGNSTNTGTAGTINTGGGGGATRSTSGTKIGSAGGSGIVIIRYQG